MSQRRPAFSSRDPLNKNPAFTSNPPYSATLPANLFANRRTFEIGTKPVLYDTPPVNTGQSYYQSVSRSTPVQRPRPETAIPFGSDLFRQPPHITSSARSLASRKSVDEPSFYTIEEHHDTLLNPSTTHQYSTLRRNQHRGVSTFPQDRSLESRPDQDLFTDVESLIAQHLPSSSSSTRPYGYQQRDYNTSNPRARTRAQVDSVETPYSHRQRFLSPQHSTSLPYNKPQVYRTDEREVERLTYRPSGSLSSSSQGGRDGSAIHPRYPIVELSIPRSPHRSSSFDYSSIDVPYIDPQPDRIAHQPDPRLSSSWSRPASSHHPRDFTPQTHQSALKERFPPPPSDSVKTSSSQRPDPSGLRSAFDTFTSEFNRSFYDQADSTSTSGTTAGGASSSSGSGLGSSSARHKLLDISSLDALLESAFGSDFDDDMSKSTKEWQSSFSMVRDRFGSREFDDEFDKHFADFTTNGSLTLPRRGLTKSASQGSMTLGRMSEAGMPRNASMLSEAVSAVERRASEAPELMRKNSRQELGNFWAETVKNSSTAAPRVPGQLSAAQRLEILQESLDMPGADTKLTRGDNIAARRAQFMKETVRSSTSSSSTLSERAPTGRSTPMPNGFMGTTSFQMDVSENETVVVQQSNGTPNFSALDNAVAELSTTSTSRSFSIRSGGCARFPTGDLGSLSPTNRKDASGQPHSPSPDAGSDASSTYVAPSGLPHPKPKHNIREQLIQAGFELRGFTYSRSFGARFTTTSPNFPVPSNGSVASRISEFEKRPGAPNLLQIACALSGVTEGSTMRSPVGPMSPRSSVYRTKPIIHADFGTSSPKTHSDSVGSPEPAFEFPPSKHVYNVNEEISYYNRDNASNKNEAQVTIISPNLDRIQLDSFQPRRNGKDSGSSKKDNQQALPSPTLAERRFEKNASATLPPPLRTDSIAPAASSSLQSPPLARRVRPVDVPRFHFPKGKPISMADNEAALRRVSEVFSRLGGKAEMMDMTEVCKAASIPIYWKRAVYDSCCGPQPKPITLADFSTWWNRMTSSSHDEAARFIFTVGGPNKNYIEKEDLAPLLQDLIESFPGLHFLREAQEFHARYVETVNVRIFWSVNRSWTGRITANELRRSNFLETVRKLETTDDINTITDYFSYEHFYVIYCKFYDIDRDHNLIVNKIDMSQHGNGAIPPRVIDRIFSGAVTRSPGGRRTQEPVETINYTDFVAFLLAEEDKKHPTSVEYWFRVLDMDGDGFLSLYEMEYFYNGVKSKMDQHNIDSMRFDDVVCNLLDLVRPRQDNVIALCDLKKCSMCTRFFNTFVNWVKYYEQESSEGERATVTDGEEELSDWDRYCLEEYEALMADDQDENEEPEDINLNLDEDDDPINGNVSMTVNMPLRDFTDSHHSPALEAL